MFTLQSKFDIADALRSRSNGTAEHFLIPDTAQYKPMYFSLYANIIFLLQTSRSRKKIANSINTFYANFNMINKIDFLNRTLYIVNISYVIFLYFFKKSKFLFYLNIFLLNLIIKLDFI